MIQDVDGKYVEKVYTDDWMTFQRRITELVCQTRSWDGEPTYKILFAVDKNYAHFDIELEGESIKVTAMGDGHVEYFTNSNELWDYVAFDYLEEKGIN